MRRLFPNIYEGWLVVAASAFYITLTYGAINYGFATIFQPFRAEFGWLSLHESTELGQDNWSHGACGRMLRKSKSDSPPDHCSVATRVTSQASAVATRSICVRPSSGSRSRFRT